jgi:hypothetical protein
MCRHGALTSADFVDIEGMGKVDLQSRAHSLVDDVVSGGVRYWYELSVFEDGCHATALLCSRGPKSIHGGLYASMEKMVTQAPRDLLEQGVPRAVATYVAESLRLFPAYC